MSTGNDRQHASDLIMCVSCLAKDGEIGEFLCKES